MSISMTDFLIQQLQLLLVQIGNIIITYIGDRARVLLYQAATLHSIVTGAINASTVILGGMLDKQKGIIQGSIDKQTATLDATLNHEFSLIRNAIEADNVMIERTLVKQSNDINAGFSGIINGLTSIFDGLADKITVDVTNNITLDDSLLTTLTGQVGEVIDSSLVALDDQRNDFVKLIKIFIDDAVGSILAGASATEQIGVDIVKAILDNAEVGKLITDAIKATSDPDKTERWIKVVLATITPGVSLGSDALADEFRRLVAIDIDSVGTLCDPLPTDSKWLEGWPVTNFLLNGVLLLLQAIAVPVAIAQQRGQICLQNDSLGIPWQILTPGDAAEALHRRIIDRDNALEQIMRGGYELEHANTLLDSTNTIPQLDILITEWLRELIKDEALESELHSLGFTDARIDLIKQIAFPIPPAQDLITMAVREVFSDVAREQGQFEDFPEDFGRYAKQQGISLEWAERYWAAHWVLPSVQLGFEMYHRLDTFGEAELKGLMKALDIMPGYRDQLIEISYRPFSRVDIRRMNRLGVLDDEAVERAYRDLGYSPEKAKQQLEFVLELNKGEDLFTLDIASDLTRSNIILFYKRGIIPNSVAIALMLQAGINAGAAALFIQNADFELELKERSNQIDIVLDKYRVEEIDHASADTELRGLGLEALELDEASLDLEKLRIGKVKQPSKTDLDKFFKNGFIDATTYVDMLMRNGYSEEWAVMYLSLIGGIPTHGQAALEVAN